MSEANIVETIARALCVVGDDPEIYWKDYVEEATAAITALEANGWAIVPCEPSDEMIEAARDVPFISLGNGEYAEPDREDIYRAMISIGKAKA